MCGSAQGCQQQCSSLKHLHSLIFFDYQKLTWKNNDVLSECQRHLKLDWHSSLMGLWVLADFPEILVLRFNVSFSVHCASFAWLMCTKQGLQAFQWSIFDLLGVSQISMNMPCRKFPEFLLVQNQTFELFSNTWSDFPWKCDVSSTASWSKFTGTAQCILFPTCCSRLWRRKTNMYTQYITACIYDFVNLLCIYIHIHIQCTYIHTYPSTFCYLFDTFSTLNKKKTVSEVLKPMMVPGMTECQPGPSWHGRCGMNPI